MNTTPSGSSSVAGTLKEDEMELKLIKEYDPKKYTLENMKEFGLKPVRSIRKMNEKLCQKLAE